MSENSVMATDTLRARSNQFLGVGLLLAGVCALLGEREQLIRSYLPAYIFWFGIALGSTFLIMIHHLVHGRWGFAAQPYLESAGRTMPLLAVLFIPIAFGMHSLYEWTHPEVVAGDALLIHKAAYLNTGAFLARAAVYFAIWISFAFYLSRATAGETGASEKSTMDRHTAGAASAPGLILFAFAGTFAAFDWMMSLEPHWFSTIYGVLVLVGMIMAALAFTVIVEFFVRRVKQPAQVLSPERVHDLGTLMFAFTLLWAYMSLSQLIIIWSANLPEEIVWYIRRITGGWLFIPVCLFFFHFLAPFFSLLNVEFKRRIGNLAAVSLLLLFMHFIEMIWFIVPAWHPGEFHIHWLDIALPFAVGGVWIGVFLRSLAGRTFPDLSWMEEEHS